MSSNLKTYFDKPSNQFFGGSQIEFHIIYFFQKSPTCSTNHKMTSTTSAVDYENFIGCKVVSNSISVQLYYVYSFKSKAGMRIMQLQWSETCSAIAKQK